MKKPYLDINKACALVLAQVAFALVFFASPPDAAAVPIFAREIGRNCTYCHTSFPRLNERGKTFRSNGYRFEGDDWLEAKEIEKIPVSIEVEVEGKYSNVVRNNVRFRSNDLILESAELIAGGAFGRSGGVTAFLVMNVAQTGLNDTGYSLTVRKAFIQANDLAGGTGEGVLNARAGIWQIGLPFLNASETPIGARYFAESKLDILTLDQRAVEFNGAVASSQDEAIVPMHRYGAGFSRNEAYSASKMAGYYGYYTANIMDFLDLGALYRGGSESLGTTDVRFAKYALSAAVNAGSFTAIAAHMNSKRRLAPAFNDELIEIEYKPFRIITLGGRYEAMSTAEKRTATAKIFMIRYNLLSNVYTQIEYRATSDGDHLVGVNEKEDNLRLFITAVF